MEKNEVFILSAVRTPIGKFGGTLQDVPVTDMGAAVVREAVDRAGVGPEDVEDVVFGNVIHTEGRDMYLSRVAAVAGGIPVSVPALTLNRLCGSGLQAIVSSASAIVLGDAQIALAGGAENMSRSPYWIGGLRWGQRMNDVAAADVMVAALTDPFQRVHMGITAENVARKWNISREDQDALAVESHRKAVTAIQECRFREQIVPIEVKQKGGSATFAVDESPRSDTTLERLAKMRPVFDQKGTVTAGNAASINDAAAALVLTNGQTVAQRNLKPIGRLVEYAVVGVEPQYMGIGPAPAIRRVLQRAGMRLEQMDIFEVNEAFAAQVLAVIRDLGLPLDKTNPNGSGISLGHPIGATGAILAVKVLHELRRTGGRYGLVAMCIGGGQGIAAIFEAVN